MSQSIDLREAARRTAILDVNARYCGLDTLVLMENAGRGVADEVLRRFGPGKRVAIFCGLGNNGGDGFVAARHLLDRATVTLVLLGSPKEIATPEARRNWQVLERTGVRHVSVRDSAAVGALDLADFDLIVDGLLGTGLAGEPREPYRSAILKINQSRAAKAAIDIPSGWGSATAVNADATFSFHFPKCEEAEVLPLGVPTDLEARIGPGDVKALSRRERDFHKGQAGRVMVVSGSAFFRGAMEYAGRAAARIVDLVYVCAPEPCAGAIDRVPDFLGTCLEGAFLAERHLQEILERVRKFGCDAVIVGPGLGMGPQEGLRDETKAMVVGLVKALPDIPIVIDADGLTAVAEHPEVLRPGTILTPHRGEFARLSSQEATVENVAAFADRWHCTLVVKAPVDIVSNGRLTKFNHTGNPGMATGGTGDVLSGTIAGFAAKNDPFAACCAGAFVTGLAGDLVKAEQGEHFVATDVLDKLSQAIKWAEDF